MGYILPQTYNDICNSNGIECPKVFIETGTFKGGVPHRIMETRANRGINPLLDETFNFYYTIEIDTTICQVASYRYKMFELYGTEISNDLIHSNDRDFSWEGVGQYFNKTLTLFEGDSADVLSELLPTISEPCCFWLDAHSGAQKYGKGIDDCALFRELNVIKDHHIKTHVIAIDDAHLFGQIQYDKKTGEISCDYSDVTVERVTQEIQSIDPNYQVELHAPFNMLMLIAYINK